MEILLSLNPLEAKALRKVLKDNKGKTINIERSHGNGIGPALLVYADDKKYNITDYGSW